MNETKKPFQGTNNPWNKDFISDKPNPTQPNGNQNHAPLKQVNQTVNKPYLDNTSDLATAPKPIAQTINQANQTSPSMPKTRQSETDKTSSLVTADKNIKPAPFTSRWKTNPSLPAKESVSPDQEWRDHVQNEMNQKSTQPIRSTLQSSTKETSSWRRTTPNSAESTTSLPLANPLPVPSQKSEIIKKASNQQESRPAQEPVITSWKSSLEMRKRNTLEPAQEWKERVHNELEQLIKSPTAPLSKSTTSTEASTLPPQAETVSWRKTESSINKTPPPISQPVTQTVQSALSTDQTVKQKVAPQARPINPSSSVATTSANSLNVTAGLTHSPALPKGTSTSLSPQPDPNKVAASSVSAQHDLNKAASSGVSTQLGPSKSQSPSLASQSGSKSESPGVSTSPDPKNAKSENPPVLPIINRVTPQNFTTAPAKVTAPIKNMEKIEPDLEPELPAPNLFDLDTHSLSNETTINNRQDRFSKAEHARFDALEKRANPFSMSAKRKSNTLWWVMGSMVIMGVGLFFGFNNFFLHKSTSKEKQAVIKQPHTTESSDTAILEKQDSASTKPASQEPSNLDFANLPTTANETKPTAQKPTVTSTATPKQDWLVAQIFKPGKESGQQGTHEKTVQTTQTTSDNRKADIKPESGPQGTSEKTVQTTQTTSDNRKVNVKSESDPQGTSKKTVQTTQTTSGNRESTKPSDNGLAKQPTTPSEIKPATPKKDWLVVQIIKPGENAEQKPEQRIEKPALLSKNSSAPGPDKKIIAFEKPKTATPKGTVVASEKINKTTTTPRLVHTAKLPLIKPIHKPINKAALEIPKKSQAHVWTIQPTSKPVVSPVLTTDPSMKEKINFVVSYGCFSNINEIFKRQEQIKARGWPVLTSHYNLDKTPMTCLFGGPFSNPKEADQATDLFAEKGCMQIPKEPLQAP